MERRTVLLDRATSIFRGDIDAQHSIIEWRKCLC